MTHIPYNDGEITEAIRQRGGAFAFAKWAMEEIQTLRSDLDAARAEIQSIYQDMAGEDI